MKCLFEVACLGVGARGRAGVTRRTGVICGMTGDLGGEKVIRSVVRDGDCKAPVPYLQKNVEGRG